PSACSASRYALPTTRSTVSFSIAGPYFRSSTCAGTFPLRKPGSFSRCASRRATSPRSRSTRSAGTVMIKRRAHVRGSSIAIFRFDDSCAIRHPGKCSHRDAKGGTRTPTGAAHEILSLARLPVPPLSRVALENLTAALRWINRAPAGRGNGRAPGAAPPRAVAGPAVVPGLPGTAPVDSRCSCARPALPAAARRRLRCAAPAAPPPPPPRSRPACGRSPPPVDPVPPPSAPPASARAGIPELPRARFGQVAQPQAEPLLRPPDWTGHLRRGRRRDLRLRQPHVEPQRRPVPDHLDGHDLPRLVLRHHALERPHPVHLPPVHRHDHVPAFQARPLRRRARREIHHQH